MSASATLVRSAVVAGLMVLTVAPSTPRAPEASAPSGPAQHRAAHFGAHTSAEATYRPHAVVRTEAQLRAAWADPRRTRIELGADIYLRACRMGDPIRESSYPLTLDGHGHRIQQTCFEKRLLRQDGTGHVVIKDVTLTRGGSDGPGAAVTTRGEITLIDSVVKQNLAEEPGGGIFSMRRATIIRSVMTGNLANDDGGAVYARRGGVRVFDSVISSNLVDGSGGAIGSTGDILIVRSHIDGNTTDGDGGALYTDEAGDVTVIDSTVDGNTADGPGGAIFTLDGDVAIINSTVNANRADDRGGAISGEADVLVIGSTIARNAAVAHVGGGIWSRGNAYVATSTIARNYAEGQGGGILAAGNLTLVDSTVSDNVSGVAANVGVGDTLRSFGSVIGPARTEGVSGEVQPTPVTCRVSRTQSFGYNLTTHASCGLDGRHDLFRPNGPGLDLLADNGGAGETLLPQAGSPVLDRIPGDRCSWRDYVDMLGGLVLLDGMIDPVRILAHDQRGIARPSGTHCDLGAVELEVAP